MPRSPKASSAGQPARRAGRRGQRHAPTTARRAAPTPRMHDHPNTHDPLHEPTSTATATATDRKPSQLIVNPPSITSVVPVIQRLASESRKIAALATSSGLPNPSG